jgi:2-C-methyl-D-erythritol 4-phosphate cytidylyltransferase/2-C-methyl-D-erythritol 2,4-cyclodiphosphate synthase
VLEWTLAALTAHPAVTDLLVVLHPDDLTRFAKTVQVAEDCALRTVPGGATRAASVRAGLAALDATVDAVLIHDAARPLLPRAVIDRVLAALQDAPGAAPALAVTDALWHGAQGRVTGLHPRDGLYRAQTPQGFRLEAIRAAHAAHPGGAADDVAVALAHGLDVTIVEGDEANMKITLPGDLARAERMLALHGKG